MYAQNMHMQIYIEILVVNRQVIIVNIFAV